MAINFLIALATALGSATLILLVLRLSLKAFAPNAFKEMISTSEKPVERQATVRIHLADRAPALVRLPTLTEKQPEKLQQAIFDTFTLSDISGTQIAALLNSSAQGARRTVVIETTIPKAAKEKEEKKRVPSVEEILSPPGQSTPNLGTTVLKKSSLGVPNEALCGSAR